MLRTILTCVFLFVLLFPAQGQKLEFVDLHNSSLFRLLKQNSIDGLNEGNAIVNIKQLRDNQTRFMVFSVGIPFLSSHGLDSLTLSDVLTFYRKFTQHYQEDLQLSLDRKTLIHAQKEGRIPFCFALEGTHLLESNVSWADSLHAVGVRFITLGHWFQNAFVVSPDDPLYENKSPIFLNENSVLSNKGKALLQRMAKLGIVLDVSHLPESLIGKIEALNIPQLKMLASHSNASEVHAHSRNLSDDMIWKLSKRNGVIGVCFHQTIIGKNDEKYLQKLIDHIRHIIHVGGVKCIAIGSDYEGGIKTPKELERLNGLTKLREALQEAGLSRRSIRKLFGENALRFIKRYVLK